MSWHLSGLRLVIESHHVDMVLSDSTCNAPNVASRCCIFQDPAPKYSSKLQNIGCMFVATWFLPNTKQNTNFTRCYDGHDCSCRHSLQFDTSWKDNSIESTARLIFELWCISGWYKLKPFPATQWTQGYHLFLDAGKGRVTLGSWAPDKCPPNGNSGRDTLSYTFRCV